MIEQEDTGRLELNGAVVDKDTKIHPFVMQQINQLHDRITTQSKTMEAMWNRLHPLTKFHDWVRETHPELADQYASIRELEELGKSNEWEKMARGYGAAQVKAAGQPVKYGVGNGNL